MSNLADQSERKFFGIISLLSSLFIIVGFGNFYGSKLLSAQESIPTIIHAHGALFFTWILFFVAQVFLIANGQVKLHMQIGKCSLIFALLMLISGILTAAHVVRAGHTGIPGLYFSTPAGFLLLNINSIVSFVVLLSLGIYFHKQAAVHKRFMLMATLVGLTPPGISRLPLLSGSQPAIAVVVMLFIFAPLVFDWRHYGKPHGVYLYCLPFVILILPPVVEALSQTEIWQIASQYILKL